jgi:hypothetical protein
MAVPYFVRKATKKNDKMFVSEAPTRASICAVISP